MARQLFHCTHGREDPERAIVLLTIEGAWLCKRGYAEEIELEGFPRLAQLMMDFADSGGEIWGCSACTTPRGITEDDLILGAKIVGAAAIVEAIAQGATPVALG